MHEILEDSRTAAKAASQEAASQGQQRLLAAGGIVAASIAALCCIGPLLLVTLGVSGAWIGTLSAFEPYKPYSLAVAASLIGAGFWHVYIRPKRACVAGSYCDRPRSGLVTQTVLWLATILALLAGTVDFWAPLFY